MPVDTRNPHWLPAAALLANPSAFYFNIHSPMNPGGFARGQLERIQ